MTVLNNVDHQEPSVIKTVYLFSTVCFVQGIAYKLSKLGELLQIYSCLCLLWLCGFKAMSFEILLLIYTVILSCFMKIWLTKKLLKIGMNGGRQEESNKGDGSWNMILKFSTLWYFYPLLFLVVLHSNIG